MTSPPTAHNAQFAAWCERLRMIDAQDRPLEFTPDETAKLQEMYRADLADQAQDLANPLYAIHNPDLPRQKQDYQHPAPFFSPTQPDEIPVAAHLWPARPAETRRFLLLIGFILAGLLFGLGLALYFASAIDGVRL